jgi:hypothetical protein
MTVSQILRGDLIAPQRSIKALQSKAFTSLSLRFKTKVGENLLLLRFNLPSTFAKSGLDVGEYISVRLVSLLRASLAMLKVLQGDNRRERNHSLLLSM